VVGSSLYVALLVGADSAVTVLRTEALGPGLWVGEGHDAVVLDLPADAPGRRAFLARLSEVVGRLLAELDDDRALLTG
jgi:hypothetical protein